MTARSFVITALSAGGLAVLAPSAHASSHREAPAIARDPAADNTNLYAWVAPGTHDRLYVVATFSPMEAPAAGPNLHDFAPDVRYEIHLADATRAGLPDHGVYFVEFRDEPGPPADPADPAAPPGGGKESFRQLSGGRQTYSVVSVRDGVRRVLVEGAPVAPPDVGPRTNALAYQIPAYDDAFAARFITPLGRDAVDGRVWAGPRDDGAYVDLAGLSDLLNLHLAPGAAADALAGFNCRAIALDLPIAAVTLDAQAPATEANGRLGVWAATSRRKSRILRPDGSTSHYGPWLQVSRIGLPFVNTLLIGTQDKDRWNGRRPGDDAALFAAYFLSPVLVRDAEAVGLYDTLGFAPDAVDALEHDRTDLLAALALLSPDEVGSNLDRVGDVLRVNLWQDSRFPNGRALPGGARPEQEQVDVTDWWLTLVLTGGAVPLGDFVDANDRAFLPEFPFLAPPHEGFSSPRGRPSTPLVEP